MSVDVANEEQVVEMVARTIGEFGRIDIFVSNAGNHRVAAYNKDNNRVLESDSGGEPDRSYGRHARSGPAYGCESKRSDDLHLIDHPV